MKISAIFMTLCLILIITGCFVSKKKLEQCNKDNELMVKQIKDDNLITVEGLNEEVRSLEQEIRELNVKLREYDSLMKNKEESAFEYEIRMNQINEELAKAYKSLSKLENEQNMRYKIIERVTYKDSSIVVYPQTNLNHIAINCPKVMREEQTYEVSAVIGYMFSEIEIKDELLKAVNEVRKERDEKALTLHDIISKEVLLGRYIKITLFDPADKFEIVVPGYYPQQDSIVKLYDDITGEYLNDFFYWKWHVTPKPNKSGEATLIVYVTPYDKDMKPQMGRERSFKVDIVLKQGFLSSMWENANRKPEWALAGIITPVLTFLAGFLVKRKKSEVKDKDEKEKA